MSSLTAAAAAAAHISSSSHMTQVSQPQPIFLAENRMDLMHRQARRIATTRRNFPTRLHWAPTPHHHNHHQGMQYNISI